MSTGPIDASQIPFPAGARYFLIGCAVVAAICFYIVYDRIGHATDFEEACNLAGGMVVRSGKYCIDPSHIIHIEVQ